MTSIRTEREPPHAAPSSGAGSLRERGQRLLFGSETPAVRRFDVAISVLIVISIVSVLLESVPDYEAAAGPVFVVLEWIVTLAFTTEYVARVYCAPVRRRYVFSFFGLVDLISTLPLYIGLLFPIASSVVVVRGLRLLRLFRMFGRGAWAERGGLVVAAIRTSLPKIGMFLAGVAVVSIILGTAMYLIEGPQSGFDSIPKGMYWAVTTLTTVGYGDVVPQSGAGRVMGTIVMILGYGVIAVPVGIVSSEIADAVEAHRHRRTCIECHTSGHATDSRFCRFCGAPLPPEDRRAPGPGDLDASVAVPRRDAVAADALSSARTHVDPSDDGRVF